MTQEEDDYEDYSDEYLAERFAFEKGDREYQRMKEEGLGH